MKPTRRGRGPRPVLARVAGYGGALLLVAAAVVVLLMPLADGDGRDGDGAGAAGTRGLPGSGTTAAPGPAGAADVPRGTSTGAPSGPVLPQDDGAGPGTGGGPTLPGRGGSGTETTWCPRGTAFYREAGDAVDVVITAATGGAVRAELTLRGYAPQSQQAAVRGGAPHTFHFRGVTARLVRRVTVTTVSAGTAVQTCHARAAA
ncbi:hypothetical protein AGRA3207_000762 [Actinomadura graeca]|uniref:Uncharacterized protein n=1 Tax=Actinomadura graeca TaxID=2750812 RepID=A0ABX8QMX8_9ACTN|nr:hypothetical protein [Actinomadura graeca]QXJ20110.1 hypothetical protein AGRA3207_000762 [Actinomadura graeca]